MASMKLLVAYFLSSTCLVSAQLQCDQPLTTGPCKAQFLRWGSKDGECIQFVYGGCQGNTNNFITKEDCERTCPPTSTVLTAQQAPVDTCQLPLVTGPCRANFPQWGSRDGECVQFTYGGCGGNANRFGTKDDCETACPPTAVAIPTSMAPTTATVQAPVDTCQLHLVTGPCMASFSMWGSKDGECVQFIYGGCDGNANRFWTKEECEATCPTTSPTTTVQAPVDTCQLPLVTGPCRASFSMWGSKDGGCVQFIYGGCDGNANRFSTRQECETACLSAKETTTTAADLCDEPLMKGPCSSRLTRWGNQNGSCVQFIYGGCDGNKNNFWTREECERACPAVSQQQQSVSVCQQPLEIGACTAYSTMWGSRDGECIPFTYSGCDGNNNRFRSKRECEQACPPATNPCTLPVERGRCYAYFLRWASVDGKCKEFVYGGCEGNANNFETRDECEATCPSTGVIQTSMAPATTTVQAPVDTCQLPLEIGPCRARYTMWGSKNGECVPFTYGGCGGNGNRFRTRDECETACPLTAAVMPTSMTFATVTEPSPVNRCQLPLEIGPCMASFSMWRSNDGECVQFIYGGCLGNANRFWTKEECETACPISSSTTTVQAPVDSCQLPLVTGPCMASFSMWGSKDGECVQFMYGGCDGNANRFRTKAQCEQACPPATNPCTLPVESGRCYAYNLRWASVDGKCKEFVYGGCEGNANNFETTDECEKTCPPTAVVIPTSMAPATTTVQTPVDTCQLPLVTGPCMASFSMWGNKDGECVQFIYGGCDGNGNRFWTKEECEAACPSPSPTVTVQALVNTCQLPLVTGPCMASFSMWGSKDGECVQFMYGGCDGNDNRFRTKARCEQACPPAANPCTLPVVSGRCDAYNMRWASVDGKCKEFVYGGCEGNANNFETRDECEKTCPPMAVVIPTSMAPAATTVQTPVDTCQLPLVTGPCMASFSMWGSKDGECVQFIYGGCVGNANRFWTKKECEEACPTISPTTTVQALVDTCQLPLVTGPCMASFSMWGSKDGECVQFIYGGCDGNANRFSTKEQCEIRCPSDAAQNVCEMPLVAGQCEAYMPSYGYKDGECVRFIYGGCGGNGNRFQTEAACMKQCGEKAKPKKCNELTARMQATCVVGDSRWIYNSARDSCDISLYTKCGKRGKDIGFNTQNTCEKRCKNGSS